jgi:hypothetical protein
MIQDTTTRAEGTANRKVDSSGNISFANATYPVGRRLAGQVVQVGCVNGIVQSIHDGKLVRSWARRHLPAKEPAKPGSVGRWGEVVLDQLVVANVEGTVDRKVDSKGAISFAGATYPIGRRFTGRMLQVRCVNGVVQLILDGTLVRAWARRHPPAKDASVQPDRSYDRGELALDHAVRLAPLDDLADDPRVVRRRVDPNGAVSFAGRYYTAGRALIGHVVQVRCVSGVVQLILDGKLVRAWRQRHTPEREQRMLQRPNPQQRTANARPLTSRHFGMGQAN